MRHELAQLAGSRQRFRGTFGRYGIRPKFNPEPVRTLVLCDVQDDDGIVLVDHLWFTCGRRFAELGELEPGTVLEFDARVMEYLRQPYRGRPERRKSEAKPVRDFRLSYPTRIEVYR